jgi:predicted RNase H-like HicB family nuclease
LRELNRSMRAIASLNDEDGYWIVECLSLKGCVSQGKTKEKAVAGHIAALEEDIAFLITM